MMTVPIEIAVFFLFGVLILVFFTNILAGAIDRAKNEILQQLKKDHQ
jgi:F0F1-type ATP synthase membrane subunit b/b'